MTEADFYNRDTIDAKLEAIHDVAKRIEAQTIKTNGRVTALESKVEKQTDDFSKWKYVVIGGLAVASMMGAPGLIDVVKTVNGL